MEQKTIEGRIPDMEGEHGNAWRCDLDLIRRANKIKEEHDATVCTWIVDAPWAHPFWRAYMIAVIHLRATAGLPAPKINLEGATHEVLLYALDPGRTPDIENPFRTRLEPANFIGQWIAVSDIEAETKIEQCVREILDGVLSPDTDFRRQWIQRFSDSNLKD